MLSSFNLHRCRCFDLVFSLFSLQPGGRRPAPGNRGAPPTRPGNPNQKHTNQLPGAKGPGGKSGPLRTIRGGGVQKKGGQKTAPAAMQIDPIITGFKGRPRNRNGGNAVSSPQNGRSRPNKKTQHFGNEILSQKGKGNPRNPQRQQQQNQQGRHQPQQQHHQPQQQHHQPQQQQQQQQQQQRTNPTNSKSKKNKPPRQQQKNQQQIHHQQYDQAAPPGFGGPSPSYHNPYQDALYAKSQKPLFARFEDLQRVPMDAMAAATVTEQPEFMAGPMNKHGVRLPV